jgi:hypothetical protein
MNKIHNPVDFSVHVLLAYKLIFNIAMRKQSTTVMFSFTWNPLE